MKESFYFKHDYNSRQDPKILKMLSKHGLSSYGIYWALIEMIASQTGKLFLPKDYETIAWDIRGDVKTIKSVVEDFGLFETNDEDFWNLRLDRDNKDRASKSKNASDAAKERWSKKKNKTTKAEDTILYFIRIFSENEKFLKVGITKESVTRRFSGKLAHYDYDIIAECDISFDDAIEIERNISQDFAKFRPSTNFGGYLECYHKEDEKKILDVVMRKSKSALRKNSRVMQGEERKGEERRREERKGKELKVAEAPSPTPGQIAKDFFDSSEQQDGVSNFLSTERNIPLEECKNEIKKFVSYWTEPTKSGKKLRWQTEKTFDVKRRLLTWLYRSKDFKKPSSGASEGLNFNFSPRK